MTVDTKMPVTIEERLEYGDEMRLPASWDEFLDLLETCEYRVEYDDGEIISFMGYASELHEILVAEIIRLLGNILSPNEYRVSGSNLALHIPGFSKKYYNADCAVVKGPSEKVALRGNMTAVANPVLLVEVLSFSTRGHDLGRKLRDYRKIPSLQQILFIESSEMYLVSHTRHNGGDEWLLKDFSSEKDSVPVLGEGTFTLGELYRKVEFEG
ncbi:MAG TPA: Uma2 family endonuclease [Bacteroidetes bacterium]|nr:Uma2 family endonuclease [Bacteroidota bacterium]